MKNAKVEILLNFLQENFIIILVCLCVVYFFYWLFKPKIIKPEYSKYSYWEKRYSVYYKNF